MPGQKKRTWKGFLLWGERNEPVTLTDDGRFILPVVIPHNDPGRIIHVEVSREMATAIGMALWKWGSE